MANWVKLGPILGRLRNGGGVIRVVEAPKSWICELCGTNCSAFMLMLGPGRKLVGVTCVDRLDLAMDRWCSAIREKAAL